MYSPNPLYLHKSINIVAPVSGRDRAKRSAWYYSGARRRKATAMGDGCLELWSC